MISENIILNNNILTSNKYSTRINSRIIRKCIINNFYITTITIYRTTSTKSSNISNNILLYSNIITQIINSTTIISLSEWEYIIRYHYIMPLIINIPPITHSHITIYKPIIPYDTIITLIIHNTTSNIRRTVQTNIRKSIILNQNSCILININHTPSNKRPRTSPRLIISESIMILRI